MNLAVGTLLGPYKITRNIGRGGMGIDYLTNLTGLPTIDLNIHSRITP